MIAQKNVTHLLIGKDLDILAAGTRADLVAGQIGVFKNGSQTPTTGSLSSEDLFRISYLDASGQVLSTPHIKFGNVSNISATDYAAATQKKVYVGYNGGSGSLNVENSDIYIMNCILKENLSSFNTTPMYEKAEYTSDDDATEKEIAEGLIVSAIKNFTSYKPLKTTVIQPGLICSAAVTVTNGFKDTQDVTVVKGLASVTCTTDVTYVSDGSKTLDIGDYLRIGGVGAGTTLTSEIYKVIGINGTIVSLDRPVLETSGTYTASDGTSDIEVIPAATMVNVDTHYGISLEAQPLLSTPGLIKYDVIDFEVLLNDAFKDTLITVVTNPSKGTGTYAEVAEIESFLKYNRGEVNRVASYPVNRPMNAVSGKTYDTIVFNYIDDSVEGLESTAKSYGSVMIETESDHNHNIYASLKTVLGI